MIFNEPVCKTNLDVTVARITLVVIECCCDVHVPEPTFMVIISHTRICKYLVGYYCDYINCVVEYNDI